VLEHGVILLQDNAAPYRHRDEENLVERWGWEVLGHRPYSPDLAPCSGYWLLAHVKERLRGPRFESEDDINTAVIACLYRLSRVEYRAAIDRYHIDEKSVRTVLVIAFSGGNIQCLNILEY
jgi:transposase